MVDTGKLNSALCAVEILNLILEYICQTPTTDSFHMHTECMVHSARSNITKPLRPFFFLLIFDLQNADGVSPLAGFSETAYICANSDHNMQF